MFTWKQFVFECKHFGYQAAIAANGVEALKALEQSPFDLVLMDVQMPEMNGLEATVKICERYPIGKRPLIIALTANAMTADENICLNAGMNGYLAKPIRKELLATVLEKAHAQISGDRSLAT